MSFEVKKETPIPSTVLDKKQLFAKDLANWRQKYAKELKQFSDEEIDGIFARNKEIESSSRVFED